MSIKSLLLILISVFVWFSLACFSTKQINSDNIILPEQNMPIISGVMKLSGALIWFPKDNPAKINDNTIEWKRKISGEKVIIRNEEEDLESIIIPLSEIDKLRIKSFRSGKMIETWYRMPHQKGITSVSKISGEIIKFPKDNPAIIKGDQIIWRRKVYGEKFIVQDSVITLESFTIPLSEVEHLQTRKINVGVTFLAVLGVLASLFLIGVVSLLTNPDWD